MPLTTYVPNSPSRKEVSIADLVDDLIGRNLIEVKHIASAVDLPRGGSFDLEQMEFQHGPQHVEAVRARPGRGSWPPGTDAVSMGWN